MCIRDRWYADKQNRTIATDAMIRKFRRSGQEPYLSLMSQGENAYLVLRGVFDVSPPALGGLSIDGKIHLLEQRLPQADHRVDHAARRAGHRQRGGSIG